VIELDRLDPGDRRPQTAGLAILKAMTRRQPSGNSMDLRLRPPMKVGRDLHKSCIDMQIRAAISSAQIRANGRRGSLHRWRSKERSAHTATHQSRRWHINTDERTTPARVPSITESDPTARQFPDIVSRRLAHAVPVLRQTVL
jgi:hypothetical protein